jgi:hypothetical protein
MAPRTVIFYDYCGEPTRVEGRVKHIDECSWPLPLSERNNGRPRAAVEIERLSFEIDQVEEIDVVAPYKPTFRERFRKFRRSLRNPLRVPQVNYLSRRFPIDA